MSVQLRTCGTPDIKKWDRRTRYKQRHRDLRLCTDCSKPAVPGAIRCSKHRTLQQTYAAGRRERPGYCRECFQKLGEEDAGRVTHNRGNCCPSRRSRL